MANGGSLITAVWAEGNAEVFKHDEAAFLAQGSELAAKYCAMPTSLSGPYHSETRCTVTVVEPVTPPEEA